MQHLHPLILGMQWHTDFVGLLLLSHVEYCYRYKVNMVLNVHRNHKAY